MTSSPPSLPRFIREQECQHVTGLSRTQRWRLEREGRFPRRVPLSDRTSGWIEDEVLEWSRARIRERDQSRREVCAA
jgi:prophage regulatory protein